MTGGALAPERRKMKAGSTEGKLTTAQIGRSGELLVQYRLLAHSIESASMTTDTGVDLVAYVPGAERAFTVQVKANLRPKPAGGKGSPALDWWLPEDSPAELVALADLSRDKVWLFWHEEIERLAQQRSSGRVHFYFYVTPPKGSRQSGSAEVDFMRFEIDNRISDLLSSAQPRAGMK